MQLKQSVKERILAVDDDDVTVELARRALAGRELVHAPSVEDALSRLRDGNYAIVLLDYRLPDGDAWEVVEAAHRSMPRVPVVLVTGYGDEQTAVEALRRGVLDYVIKSHDFAERLDAAVTRALRLADVERRNIHLAALVRTAEDAIIALAPDGTITSWNEGATRLYGYSASQALGQSVLMLVPESRRAEVSERIRGVIAGRRIKAHEEARRKADGDLIFVSLRAWPVLVEGERVEVAWVERDITARKESERSRDQAMRALADSEERFRLVFEDAPFGMVLADVAGRIQQVNRTLCAMLGYEEKDLIGRTTESLTHAGDVEEELALGERLLHDEIASYRIEKRWRRQDGHTVWTVLTTTLLRDPTGAPLWRLGVVENLEERRKLEDQLREAQKMEVVGRLAGGVAHDFNNLMTVIGGYTELARLSVAPGEPLRDELDMVMDATRRAAALTRQLLAFSRRQILDPRNVDLNEVISNLQPLLRRLIGEDIELELRLSAVPATVRIDPAQVEQVLLNLMINSRDAMPRGGRVTAETAVVVLDERDAEGLTGISSGCYVRMVVRDNGVGMDEATLKNAFEPFFTTKGPDRGTGLGLATVHSIVRQARGHVEAHSRAGQGAAFVIHLPRTEPRLLARENEGPRRRVSLQGRELVLVAEDDPLVRRFTAAVLRRNGYTVLEAVDGEQALEMIERNAGIHLLLSNVVMPRLGGMALQRAVAKRRPDLSFLFMSGYAGDVIHRDVFPLPTSNVLQKPFSAESLLRRVRMLLDYRAVGPAGVEESTAG